MLNEKGQEIVPFLLSFTAVGYTGAGHAGNSPNAFSSSPPIRLLQAMETS